MVFGGISEHGKGDDHVSYRILAMQCRQNSLSDVPKGLFVTLSRNQMLWIHGRGHFRVAVKGTFCFCLNTLRLPFDSVG